VQKTTTTTKIDKVKLNSSKKYKYYLNFKSEKKDFFFTLPFMEIWRVRKQKKTFLLVTQLKTKSKCKINFIFFLDKVVIKFKVFLSLIKIKESNERKCTTIRAL
jgi:hypothetical protein